MRELRERLLRAGISPRAVDRYVSELQDHFDDLVDDLTADGLSPAVAQHIALRRLGDPDQLVVPMLADRHFRSLASRAPMLAWCALPLLGLASVAALLTVSIVVAVRNGLPPADLGALAGVLLLLAPIAIGWGLAVDAFRRRATLMWPALGIACTIGLGAALQLQVDATAIAVSLATPAWPQLVVYGLLTFVPLTVFRFRIV